MTTPIGLVVPGPYASAAPGYHAQGWAPLPVPPRRKSPPPPNWTGHGAPYPSGPDVHAWTETHGDHNVALRLPGNVVGLDADCYAGKAGCQTMAELTKAYGPLPLTPYGTSRDDWSGIRLYQVPFGLGWPGQAGPGVEIIQADHRYAMAAPSIHPEGRVYRWENAPLGLPAPTALPWLPQAWVTGLSLGRDQGKTHAPPVSFDAADSYLRTLPPGPPCKAVEDALTKARDELVSGGSRHDAALHGVLRLVRLGEQGHHGAGAALAILANSFTDATASDRLRPHDPWELARMRAGAVAIVRAEPTPDDDRGCCPDSSSLAFGPAAQANTSWSQESGGTAMREFVPRPTPDEVLWRPRLSQLALRLTEGTEIDPVGVLAEALCGFGVFIGPGPYVRVASDRHPLLVWVLLTGHTTVGRKGMADAAARSLLRAVDDGFVATNRVTGLSSGEGLIERVRDGEPENPNDSEERAARRDRGVSDKRLWVVEAEWATAMIRAGREGSTLGPVMRDAWSGTNLGVLNRHALRATRPHIGITGHITPAEFVTRLHAVELTAGTYNRFLPVFVERAQIVPDPPTVDASALRTEAFELRRACAEARKLQAIGRSADFRELWADVYEELTTDDENRALGQFTARAAPHTLRIAAVFALTEGRGVMTADDLDCALAFVNYSMASARHVVGAVADQAVVEHFRAALVAAGGAWVTRDHIYRDVFQRHVKRSTLDAAWLVLSADPHYQAQQEQTGGRPRTSYRYTPYDAAP